VSLLREGHKGEVASLEGLAPSRYSAASSMGVDGVVPSRHGHGCRVNGSGRTGHEVSLWVPPSLQPMALLCS
jgi:hypothetical protein